MALCAGARLGPYEILEPIGEGGMGEVYKARDTRLRREVAIKVSKQQFNERFEREARAVASLNHPNICTLHDVGPDYLVMELVEGPTLAERIKRGAIPIEESLGIARQVADALEAAHEKGIIHRDLKPGNIKITIDGARVKVLDFGLAKLSRPSADENTNLSGSPTITMSLTGAGGVLGTTGYMAPEQACGAPVDKRADIWAFGVVLYEMVTGRRPFAGASASDTLAAVVAKDPDWTRVPHKVQRLLRSCLEKEPKKRLHDIGDAWGLLEEAPLSPPAQPSWRWLVAAGLALAAIVAALWVWRPLGQRVEPIQRALVRLEMDLGSGAPPANGGANVALSPDGARLAFATAGPDGKSRLLTRRLDQPKAAELAGTEGAYAPFFSPDGKWIGFFAPGKLNKVPVDGGAVIGLCDVAIGRGASWGEDGNIVLAPDVQTRLLRVPAAGGGVPAPLTEFQGGEVSHRWPQVLPGGKAVLFTALTAANFAAFDEANIEVVSLTSGQTKTLYREGTYARYLASGHLLYVRNGTAFAVPFDLDRLEVHGTPVPVIEQVTYVSTGGSAQLDVSRNGTLVYQSGPSDESRQTIQWMDASGKVEPLLAKPAFYRWLRFSPDGKRLVYRAARGSGTDLWVYDWQRGTETRLTTDAAIHNSPAWTADGRYIAYQAEGGMFLVSADGGKPRLLMEAKNTPFPESFTADGRWLAFSVSNPVSGDLDIWAAPLEGSGDNLKAGKPEPFVQTPAHERDAAFSPDGHWVAYMSTASGSYEIYVRAFPGTASVSSAKQVSNSGGFNPVWSRTGRELFYRNTDNRIMVVGYSSHGDSFVPEKPRVWSETRIQGTDIMPGFDVTPDGKRLAVLMKVGNPEPQDARHHVTLVLNFFEEVRRRLAGDK